MHNLPCFVTIVLAFILTYTRAFVRTTSSCRHHAKMSEPFCSKLGALTERQMQFWEDVEDGLNDIEVFYAKRGQNIDRIREFGKRYDLGNWFCQQSDTYSCLTRLLPLWFKLLFFDPTELEEKYHSKLDMQKANNRRRSIYQA